MSSLANFRDGFSSGMNFLRRRLSSDDLNEDFQDAASDTAGFSFYLPPPKKGSAHASAPTSPSRNNSQPGPVPRGGSVPPQSAAAAAGPGNSTQKPTYNKERCKTLLIIDSSVVDWSKYFRNRKVLGDWDIRVEQAEFSEINLASYSESGVIADIQVMRNGTRVVRSFKPDFAVIRQLVSDANEDWRNIVIGLHYGGVPSINSLSSIFSFLDKPWVFSQLIQIQRRLGSERFPLIEQSYFPSHRQMSVTPQFPVVVKIGHAHSGMGSVKIDNQCDFEDIVGVVAVTRCYCTTEPFVDSAYDLYIQKIGNNYNAFRKSSVSGNWKVNTGSSMLEQVSMNERYRLWVDECSLLFGGLDVVAVKAVVTKDGREFILEVNDSSSMPLLGETQEEDRKRLVDVIVSRMEEVYSSRRPSIQTQQMTTMLSKAVSADDSLAHLSMMNGQSAAADPMNRGPSRMSHQQQQQQPPYPLVQGSSSVTAAIPINSRPIAGPPGPSPQKMSLVDYSAQRTTGDQSRLLKMPSEPYPHGGGLGNEGDEGDR